MTDPVLAYALVLFCIAVYVVADGFDLGVGILFLIAPREADRVLMIASVEPVWDANETWLVLGGTLLFAAFPAAYYLLLPALYVPILLMVSALVLRGVAFAFYGQAESSRRFWNVAFSAGSLLATCCQGFILGGIIAGVTVRDDMFAGGALDFLNPVGVLCALGLIGGYALLGAAWLVWKTDGPTQVFAREATRSAALLTAAMMLLVSAASAWRVPEISQRWFAWPTIAWLMPIPCVTAAALFAIWRRTWIARDGEAIVLAVIVFLLGLVGLVASLWPYVVPRTITLWDGIADRQTLAFISVGVVVVMPIVLAYQAHGYWVFRGKTRPEVSLH